MPDEVVKLYEKGLGCYEEIMYYSIPPYCHIEAKY
jgi:hypothetical protein